MIQLNDLEKTIARLLVKIAEKKSYYTYSELTEAIKKECGIEVNVHFGLSRPLGNVSILCNELGLPLLSVRVQYKNSTKTAEGFYGIACELKPEYCEMKPREVHLKEMELTRNCTEWQRLLDVIDNSPSSVRITNLSSTQGKEIEATGETPLPKNQHRYNNQSLYPDDLPDDSPEYLEGKKKEVLINTYERNPIARQKCIEHYGATCCICKTDFGEKYGTYFTGMIHVHHLKMISETCGEYTIDPIEDLRPVCPNCHMVLHSKKEGCYTIDEAKGFLQKQQQNSDSL